MRQRSCQVVWRVLAGCPFGENEGQVVVGRVAAALQRAVEEGVSQPSARRLLPVPPSEPALPQPDLHQLRHKVSAFIQRYLGRGNKIDPLLSELQLMRCAKMIDEYEGIHPQLDRAEKWLLWSGALASIPALWVAATEAWGQFDGEVNDVFYLFVPVLVPFGAFWVFHTRVDRYFGLNDTIQRKCLSADSEARLLEKEGGTNPWRHVFSALDQKVVTGGELPVLDLPVAIGGEEFLDEVPVGISIAGVGILAGAVALVTASFFVPWEVVVPSVSLPELTAAAPVLAL